MSVQEQVLPSTPHQNATTYVEHLGAFASGLSFVDLPAEVVDRVTLLVLDYVGQVLAGRNGSGAKMVLDLVTEDGGHEESTIIGCGYRVDARGAAMANATFAESLEYGDTHRVDAGRGTGIHAGMCVIPAVLAMGEAHRVDGKRLITAIVAGLETSVRIARVAPMSFVDRGYHITSVCSSFGAAAGAGSILRLSAHEMAHSIAMCSSFAGGIMEYHHDGSWIKQLHVGWQATAGLFAARLAARGFTGPRTCFEGQAGLFQTHLPGIAYDFGALVHGLGRDWETAAVFPRAYPLCNVSGPFIDASIAIRERAKVDPRSIIAIECEMAPEAVNVICEPLDIKHQPPTPFAAKYSLPYAVGLALSKGGIDIDDFTDSSFPNEDALDLAGKVSYVIEESRFMESGCVRITLSDGTTESYDVAFKRGSLQNPLTREDVIDKFRGLARRAATADELERLERRLLALSEIDDLSVELAPLLSTTYPER